ncbi:hypothetical protein [Candidiatus Paracoxiella cheracis]|uniref:hypothetical protein n=1 Tax=Candidiatus Paracoxiella cheracis TaxID=3405120 RepID=UPI003BF4752B
MKDSFTLVEAYDSSNSQAIFDHYNQTEDAQACRDARDRLLPSLSIIDSQYATT